MAFGKRRQERIVDQTAKLIDELEAKGLLEDLLKFRFCPYCGNRFEFDDDEIFDRVYTCSRCKIRVDKETLQRFEERVFDK